MPEDAAAIDPLMHGLRSKGLKKGSVSLVGAVAIGLAATAPAYSLTGALGHGAEESGYQLPIVFILAVIPMYFVALAYKHLTDAAPDAGTVFTWGSKAIAPHIGWMGGFALMLSSILAGVGAAGILTNAAAVWLGMDTAPVWFHLIVATVFILLTTWLVARGAEESSRATLILTILQYGGLALFAVIMLVAVFRGHEGPDAHSFSWEWFNPFAIHDFSGLLGGFLVAIFIFWGFDASLAMSEETTGTSAQAGRSGVTAILITVATYVIFSVAALAYAGIDPNSPTSLTNAANIDDVFTTLASQSIGTRGAMIAALVVGVSAFSATMSTVMPTARGLLSMATYRALPGRFGSVSEVSATPKFATWVIGLTSLAIYCTLDVISDSVVADSVYSVGISIMLYYSVVAVSSVVYFWRTAFRSWRTAMGQVILPGIGALVLIPVGIVEAYLMADPTTGSGGSILGIGTAFIIGVFGLVVGVVLMAIWNLKAPGFFRGQTLPRERS
ncbi:APC family permease [Mycolicibacterium sphagni]|uniref:Amino acid permease n=1 Tax=Mycolicibacterium sphagni TaxID=1786 RepID=A0A255DNS0_9MYCO|nr:APC family permease [Mycolicibacterium sphagni]MCV7176800.1 APC family permease [Mycolicibacterium sphagni]OYN77303.1 amino acid permease [Mycolicibacterium sphagni]